MKKLSLLAKQVVIERLCVLAIGLISIVHYLIIQWTTQKPVNEETMAIGNDIASSFLWFLVIPSLIIIVALLLKLAFIKWLVLIWDIVFLIILAKYVWPPFLSVAIPVVLFELISLFRNQAAEQKAAGTNDS